MEPQRDQQFAIAPRRWRLASPLTATILGALLVACLGAYVLLLAVSHSLYDSSTAGTVVVSIGEVVVVAVMSVFGAVGVVVARRQPRNAVGWLLLGVGLSFVLGTADAELYLQLDYGTHHGALPFGSLAVILGQCWPAALLLAPLAIFLFPDGRLPSYRWRWVLRAYIASAAVIMASQLVPGFAAIIVNNVRIDSSGLLTTPGPRWFSNPVLTAGALPLLLATPACWLAFVARQILSYRQATGERRQQLKWVLCGAVISAGSIPVFIGSGTFNYLGGVLGLAALPVSIGVGILKYRLYEIDRLISRTISYAIITGLLVSMYFGVVALTTRTLPFSSPVGVAAATLAAAALFNPLRRRVQRLVDRRFNRARYDAEATVAAFTARLRDAVDLDAVQTDLVDAVARSLQPRYASVWIKPKS